MSSLVSCKERRTQSWQQGPPVSSPFCLSPTWIQAPLGALCCPNTFPVSVFHQRRKEQCLDLGITRRSILGEFERGRDHPPPQISAPRGPASRSRGAEAGTTHGEVREERSVQRGQPAAHGQGVARARPQPPQPWGAQDPQPSPPAPRGTRAGAAGHSPSIASTPSSPNSPSSSALASSRSSPHSPVSRLRGERGHRPLPRPLPGADPAVPGADRLPGDSGALTRR